MPKLLKQLNWKLESQPARDPGAVGITFIDVLFALVIGVIFQQFADIVLKATQTGQGMHWPGLSHLGVGFILVTASWVGYHNSVHKPKLMIRFVNLPMCQFLLDNAMVIAYWLLPQYAEGTSINLSNRSVSHVIENSAVPEAFLVMLCFAFYSLWDLLAYIIHRGSSKYRQVLHQDSNKGYPPLRRWASSLFSVLFAIVLLVVLQSEKSAGQPPSDNFVIGIDFLLIAMLIGYRLFKILLTPFDGDKASADDGGGPTANASTEQKALQ